MRGIARPEGLFKDTLITDQPWRGQQRRTRMVVYRWIGKGNTDPMPPIAMLNQTCERVTGALNGAGVVCVRQNGGQVHDWLLRHLIPALSGWIKGRCTVTPPILTAVTHRKAPCRCRTILPKPSCSPRPCPIRTRGVVVR